MICVCFYVIECSTQKTNMQLGSLKFLRIIVIFLRGVIHFLNEKLDTVGTQRLYTSNTNNIIAISFMVLKLELLHVLVTVSC